MKTVDFSGRPFHFIGIGGIGMSALAYILAKRQYPVSGSDLRSSHITERLESVGTHIFHRQDPSNLQLFQSTRLTTQKPTAVAVGASAQSIGEMNGHNPTRTKHHALLNSGTATSPLPQVICSTAISPTNAEYQAAREQGCPIFHRSDLLAALIDTYEGIAVSGTHGKTTTSSLIAYLLLKAGIDPTIIIGGEVDAWEGNARLGKGPYLVAEADESDGSLTKHHPAIGVVTNIELDHPDHFANLAEVIDIFDTFGKQCKTLIACLDCDIIRSQLTPQITYSLDPERGADYTVTQLCQNSDGCLAQVWEQGICLGTLQLPLPGKHNLSNALAAVAVGRYIGLTFESITAALATFPGAKRRFEIKGQCQGMTFVDDYAHHPSEIQVTLAAGRLKVDGRRYQRLIAIFQPHRFSRTQAFLSEFGASFADADLTIVTDIYSAGETNTTNIRPQAMVAAIAAHSSPLVSYCALPALCEHLLTVLNPGDLILFLGAGNLNQEIPKVLARYCNGSS